MNCHPWCGAVPRRAPAHLPALLLAAALALPAAAQEAGAPPASAASAVSAAPPAPVPAATAPAAQRPAPAASFQPPAAPAAGGLLQTVLALGLVLALLGGMAWFMKRFGPRVAGGGARMRVVGALSLGGRERVVTVEVADQWIVVGVAPGRVNLLATLPRQEGVEPPAPIAAGLPSGFADWLKQTIEKRNAK